jgi:hypothetical protein
VAPGAVVPRERLPCTVENAAVATGTDRVDKTYELSPAPSSQVRVINLGTDRDAETAIFTLKAKPPLPAGVERQINLVADTIARTGQEEAETVQFPEPTFSEINVSDDRETIRFKMCLDPPNDLPAGRYTGVVDVEGPAGVEATAVTVTLNAKNGALFRSGLVLTLALAALTLLYKEAADRHAAHPTDKWGPDVRAALKDVGWVAGTLFALGATFGTLYAVWSKDPSWGSKDLGAVAALVGTGLAAVGARAILRPAKQ